MCLRLRRADGPKADVAVEVAAQLRARGFPATTPSMVTARYSRRAELKTMGGSARRNGTIKVSKPGPIHAIGFCSGSTHAGSCVPLMLSTNGWMNCHLHLLARSRQLARKALPFVRCFEDRAYGVAWNLGESTGARAVPRAT
jgi:hypothetical protein